MQRISRTFPPQVALQNLLDAEDLESKNSASTSAELARAKEKRIKNLRSHVVGRKTALNVLRRSDPEKRYLFYLSDRDFKDCTAQALIDSQRPIHFGSTLTLGTSDTIQNLELHLKFQKYFKRIVILIAMYFPTFQV
jgi:hypothetical protein